MLLLRPAALAVCAAMLFAAALPSLKAQATNAEKGAPVPLVAAPIVDPIVQPDGSTTFRLALPKAEQVSLSLEGRKDPIAMTKGADGVWAVTIPGLAPEYYSYTFQVDGVSLTDPANTSVKTSFFSKQSVFLVPGHPPAAWEIEDVPHGVVHHHSYYSQIVGTNSEYYVYTPPGFDPGAAKTYPVLYLLHGYSDEPSAWTAMGKANVILDNLIASGRAKPMVVVMPWGYGDMRVITQGWASWRDRSLVVSNFSHFGEALYKEVMPAVQKQYRISSRREDHAIAGLSMGGAETLLIGLNHLADFASIGAFSAGGLGSDHFELLFPEILAEPATTLLPSRLKLLWIACGTEDGLIDPNRKFIAWLRGKGFQPTAIETPGMHVWMLWREDLSNFAPLLFQAR